MTTAASDRSLAEISQSSTRPPDQSLIPIARETDCGIMFFKTTESERRVCSDLKEKQKEMPQRKSTVRATKKKKTSTKTARPKKALAEPKVIAPRTTAAPKENYTEEYSEYLERYELYGEGRPKLTPSEFERLDEELIDLLALEADQGVLNDDQIVRLQELEFLLLDSEQ